ncbi:MAG: ABC transporter permease [Acidobacteriia bacterium]|nr:ABC transporter permease [Terriglobia bacterium]
MVFLFTIIRVALKALGLNKMRSILTMLGIIIGVGAVIAMVSIGQGAQATIAEQIASAGSNMLYVTAGSYNRGGVRSGAGTSSSLTVEDYQGIVRECTAVREASPLVRASAPVVFGDENWFTNIQGVNTNFLRIKLWEMETGTFFTDQDENAAERVCILGKTVVDNLFPGQDPVGQEIRIRNAPWRVIGVLKSKGQSGMGQDQDDTIIAPYTTVQKKLLGITYINAVMVSAVSQTATSTAENQINELLMQRHHIASAEDADFQVRNLSDIAELANNSNKVMTLLLASIAFVSLIVGGIGVMNIMLVSVTERTREIGIRMAVGATGGDVQFQFLTEAVVLAIFGGILGICCGVGASKAISDSLGWPTLVSSAAIGLAFTFAGAIGIAAGWYPALKASRLDPIDALRYE